MTQSGNSTTHLPVCINANVCGGCIYQGVPYAQQLDYKKTEIQKLLREAGMDPFLATEIEPSPCIYRYRNKMEYTFGNEQKDGPLSLGLHKSRSFMSIVHAGDCQLVPEAFNVIVKAVHAFCVDQGYSFYHKKRHEGLLRNLIVRKGARTDELMVNIVTTSQHTLDSDAFKNVVLTLPLSEKVVSLLHTVNDGVADAVKPDKVNILYGRDYYVERLLGLEFNVGAFSFFQTNVEAVERMFSGAISQISDIEGKTVWDLYSGTGTIALTMAGAAKQVVGVELSEQSVEMAKEGAYRNQLNHCTFIQGDVLRVCDELYPLPDIIVVDPPRAGIHPKLLSNIAAIQAPQFLYISCNPKTMIRDLLTMIESGYRLRQFRLHDNFPFTKHIEATALLAR